MSVLLPGGDRLQNRGWGFLDVVGRLKPGVSLSEAQAHMKVVASTLEKAYPEHNENRTVLLVPETDALLPERAQGLATRLVGILMGVVAFVLLIACANVANLQMARVKSREGEMGVRLALGANRSRLFRQLLTESILLALIAGLAGLGLAYGLNCALQSISLPVGAPVSVDVHLDARVLAFTAGVTLLAAVLFGLAPAFRTIRSSPSLQGGPSARVVGTSRLGSILVGAQIALSLLLLIGASLFLRSLRDAQEVDPGFDANGVLLASVDPVLQGYDLAGSRRFYEALSRNAARLPGVRSVALADSVPMQLGSSQWDVTIEGYVPAKNERMNIDYNIVSPGYFETMGIPLLSGRDFGPDDRAEGQGALIVNATMAKHFFAEGDAVGRRVATGGRDRVIVGVVGDTKVYSLGERPLSYMYFPYEQTPRATGLILHVRTGGDPVSLVEPVRAEVRALDSGLPLFDIETIQERLAFGLLSSRLSASVLGVFGLLALVMAGIGLYGVTAYGVSQRTREIGLRMALGAGTAEVIRLVLGRVALVTAIGMVMGLTGGLLFSRVARGLLFGTSGNEAVSFVVAPLVILLAALLAGYLPARRASALDPMRALRYE
jgi:putative ABC transport system permease protein